MYRGSKNCSSPVSLAFVRGIHAWQLCLNVAAVVLHQAHDFGWLFWLLQINRHPPAGNWMVIGFWSACEACLWPAPSDTIKQAVLRQ